MNTAWFRETEPYDEQERLRRNLRDAETRFAAFAEIGADWFWEMDAQLRFTYISERVTDAIGIPVDQLIGRTREEVYAASQHENESPLWRQHLDDLQARRPFRDVELCYRSINNALTIVALSGQPAYDEAGTFQGYRGVGRDITAQKQTEASLREAKRVAEYANRMKTRFLIAASHDLQQPLQTINAIHALLTRTVAEPSARPHIDALAETVESMRTMLNVLLDVNQPQAGVLVPKIRNFPVNDLLDRIQSDFNYLAAEKGLALRVLRSQAWLHSDPHLLQQIIRNLIANAIKYTDRGKVLLGCRRCGAALRIEVWDTGIGINEAEYQYIFEEFYQPAGTTRHDRPGLGLGLAIVEHLSRLLRLTLDFRSTPGKGSMFAVTVPLAISSPETDRKNENGLSFEADLNGAKILYVEDHPTVLDSMRYLLTAEGFSVIPASSVEQVSRLLREPDFQSDLIVTDYRLATGVIGADIITQVRQALAAPIPAIIMTADGSGAVARLAQQLDCKVLIKPVDSERLLDTIHHLLGVRALI